MINVGPSDYLSDMGNWIDLVYIWGSIAMSIVHLELTAYHVISKALMCLVVTLSIRRTFNFLRIFKALSPIVTMLTNVIWQLRIFLTFYFILTLLFSLMYGVLGIGNFKLEGKFREKFYNTEQMGDMPGLEYKKIGLFFGNLFQTVRISMGDFSIIAAAEYLDDSENIIFWVIFLLTCIITCIIFLNFIVAEAGNSYNEVSEELSNFIWQQQADLCAEAEGLFPSFLKKEKHYPKYIIIRKVEI